MTIQDRKRKKRSEDIKKQLAKNRAEAFVGCFLFITLGVPMLLSLASIYFLHNETLAYIILFVGFLVFFMLTTA